MASLESHLENATNARFDGNVVSSFGDAYGEFAAAAWCGIKCPLLSNGLVRFSGEDALAFINAQFTTNCLQLTPSQGQLSGWCDPKGRVLFLFVLFTHGADYFAVLPAVQIPKFIQRLRMYVLRAAVQVEDATAEYRQIGIVHAPVEESTTNAPWSVSATDHLMAGIRFGPGAPRTLAIVAANNALDYWLAEPQPGAGEPAWQAMNALAGVPEIDDVSSGEYVPQQLNFDWLDAVSFAKGCYPGQEIVARLKYRGEVKKRLAAASCRSGAPIAGGTAMRLPGEDRTVGRVLHAIAVSTDESILSAVVDVAADWSQIVIEGHEGIELRRLELPYADG